MLISRQQVKLHAPGLILGTLLIVVGFGFHFWSSREAGRWVGGSSLVGLVLGSIAAFIILFELLLWPRKWLRKYKLGRTKYWLAAHLWLGLATGPLAWMHAGYRFGGSFSTILMLLLFFVLASGVYGWLMQIWLPRWMMANLPAETIHAQIDDVAQYAVLDARTLIARAYGPRSQTSLLTKEEERTSVRVGAVQAQGGLRGRMLADVSFEVDSKDRESIWKFFEEEIEPYLTEGGSKKPTLFADKQKSAQRFSLYRGAFSATAKPILDQLENFCEQRRQFDIQKKIHVWLHGWVAIHASVSVALGILLVAHIFLAIRFW